MDGSKVLTEGHAGSGTGEDEDEHGDELRDGGLGGVGVRQLPRSAHGDPAHRHYGLRKSSSACSRPVCGLQGKMELYVTCSSTGQVSGSSSAIYRAWRDGMHPKPGLEAGRTWPKDGMQYKLMLETRQEGAPG